jgi:hypothetical protein
MLYSEIIAVCSQIHTKHINKLCRQNVEFFMLKLAVHKVTIKQYGTELLRPYHDTFPVFIRSV